MNFSNGKSGKFVVLAFTGIEGAGNGRAMPSGRAALLRSSYAARPEVVALPEKQQIEILPNCR